MKQLSNIKLYAVFLCLIMVTTVDAGAQSCPNGLFPSSEASVVSDKVGEANAVLLRTWTLSQWSCIGNLTVPQHLALESEYQAQIANLEGLDNDVSSIFSQETKDYIEAVIDPIGWGLQGSSIATASQGCMAIALSQAAQRRLDRCFKNGVTQSIP